MNEICFQSSTVQTLGADTFVRHFGLDNLAYQDALQIALTEVSIFYSGEQSLIEAVENYKLSVSELTPHPMKGLLMSTVSNTQNKPTLDDLITRLVTDVNCSGIEPAIARELAAPIARHHLAKNSPYHVVKVAFLVRAENYQASHKTNNNNQSPEFIIQGIG